MKAADKENLKALADRVTTDRRFCADEYHLVLAAGAQALLVEIEHLLAQVRLAGVAGEMAVNDAVGRAATEYGVAIFERDRLKTEIEVHRRSAQDALSGQLHLTNERDLLKIELEVLRKKIADKVVCDLDLFESLRDSAAAEADQHQQFLSGYRPERQQLLDQIVERCDQLIADVTGRRDNQNLARQVGRKHE